MGRFKMAACTEGIGAAPWKTSKQMQNANIYYIPWLFYCISSANFIVFEKTMHENSDFVHLLHWWTLLENCSVHVDIPHTKRLLCYRAYAFSGFGWCSTYDCWATALKLSPKTPRMLVHRLLGLLFRHFGCGYVSQTTPRTLNTWNCE